MRQTVSFLFREQKMKIHSRVLYCGLACALALSGCKKEAPNTMSTTSSAPSTPAPTQPATNTPPATATTSDGGTSSVDTTAKLAGAQWATKQDEIKNDPKGQWAIQATASSTYQDAQGTSSWSANQATGAPNVEKYADDGNAWTSKAQDAGIEWLDLKFPRAVHAEEVRVRESFGSGAVVKIEVFDEQGNAHAVWAGNDPTTELNYLMVKFPKTAFKTDRVKVTLATNVIPGWNEIDAVQLVGSD
jgi:hypothetical protein